MYTTPATMKSKRYIFIYETYVSYIKFVFEDVILLSKIYHKTTLLWVIVKSKINIAAFSGCFGF